MTDRSPTCELWAEAVSLLAAGCLSAGEERDVRRHLDACAACRRQFEQLEVVCHEIRAARPASESFGADVAARAMSAALHPVPVLAANRRLRWSIAASFALAASLLLILVWQGVFDLAPHEPDLARQGPALRIAADDAGPAADALRQPPTMLAYERALAESDEDFDRLLTAEAQRLVCLCDHQSPVTLFKELAP